jgi:hypothetical protein
MKLFKIASASLVLLAFANSAFAISTKNLAEKCLEVGQIKVLSEAASKQCTIYPDQVVVQSVDNRWYNPSKYVWYTSSVSCGEEGPITVLVQYENGLCF